MKGTGGLIKRNSFCGMVQPSLALVTWMQPNESRQTADKNCHDETERELRKGRERQRERERESVQG